MPPIIVLHRYFIAASKMRILFDQTLCNAEYWKKYEGRDPVSTAYLMHADDYGIFMLYWYGGLYIVIEGYRELALSDAKIDDLLISPNVDSLRRCRNTVFHFQTDYFDKRFLNFIGQQGVVQWVRQLTEAFSEFFLREVAIAAATDNA